MIAIIIFFVWWIVGCAAHIYWHIKEFDFTTSDIFGMLVVGMFFGPTVILIMWRESKEPKILIRYRGK